MAYYVKSLDVPLSLEESFDYLAGFENVAEWDPGVAKAKRLDEGPLEVGSTFRVVSQFFGRRVPLTYRITKLDAPKRVVLEAATDDFRSVDTISFEPVRGGTRITYHADLQLAGWRRALDLPLQLAFAWIANDAVRGLQTKLGRLPQRGRA